MKETRTLWEFIDEFNKENEGEWLLRLGGWDMGFLHAQVLRLHYLQHPSYPSELISALSGRWGPETQSTLLSIIEQKKKTITDKVGTDWEEKWAEMLKEAMNNGGYLDFPLHLTGGQYVRVNVLACGGDWRKCLAGVSAAARSVYGEMFKKMRKEEQHE